MLTNIVSRFTVYRSSHKPKIHIRKLKTWFCKTTKKMPWYLKKFGLNLKQ